MCVYCACVCAHVYTHVHVYDVCAEHGCKSTKVWECGGQTEQCKESVFALPLGSRQVSLAVHCCGRASWLPASGGSVSVSHPPESQHWNHRWLSLHGMQGIRLVTSAFPTKPSFCM